MDRSKREEEINEIEREDKLEVQSVLILYGGVFRFNGMYSGNNLLPHVLFSGCGGQAVKENSGGSRAALRRRVE